MPIQCWWVAGWHVVMDTAAGAAVEAVAGPPDPLASPPCSPTLPTPALRIQGAAEATTDYSPLAIPRTLELNLHTQM